ncbi:MAG: diaminopimelate epimerase [Salinibacter sp.]|uniref:diaminopimelate epimerase n=1 Tax=Salinibacter sp. TaxID=2065818 RepID=UPI0035D49AFE
MTQPSVVEFTKMQGTGNDFLVVDNRSLPFSPDDLSALAATWCPRRYGVGADGLLALDEPTTPESDYRMLYMNADGSRATMCGNGARCLAQFARQHDLSGPELTFETDAGRYHAAFQDGDDERVRLFVPEIAEFRLRVDLDQPIPDAIEALHYAHAGTEHLVAFVDNPGSVPVRDWGASLRQDPSLKPAGANVNFVRVDEDRALSVRTYEKGVEDETLSCGTGVLAAAVAAERTERVEGPPVMVHAEGGNLQVGTASTARGRERYLEGPAVTVFRGRVDVPR